MVEVQGDQQVVDQSSVRMVKGYIEVYSKESPRLMPERGLKFYIDLLPRTA